MNIAPVQLRGRSEREGRLREKEVQNIGREKKKFTPTPTPSKTRQDVGFCRARHRVPGAHQNHLRRLLLAVRVLCAAGQEPSEGIWAVGDRDRCNRRHWQGDGGGAEQEGDEGAAGEQDAGEAGGDAEGAEGGERDRV